MGKEDKICKLEKQIDDLRRKVNYQTRDYSIKYMYDQFHDNKFFIPQEYQRKFIWGKKNKSRLIESILLGLPIPFMFFGEIDDGTTEIIDGAQRISTIVEFLDDDLKISKDVSKLTELEGFKFSDLPKRYKSKLESTNMRVIVLDSEVDIDIRKEIFNRINTAGQKANNSEIRRGIYEGDFMNFLKECAEMDLFKELCPLSKRKIDRYENIELVTRFFSYSDDYKNFKGRVDNFNDSYVEKMNQQFEKEVKERMKNEFVNMLNFVKENFPKGFSPEGRNAVPRVRFEAISVGVNLALREDKNLKIDNSDWIHSEDFIYHTTTHASNTKKRLAGRIEYVKGSLLGNI